MINIGIIGGSGYTAGELIRILMFHPNATLDFVYSTTNAGKPLHVAHHDLMGDIEMNFTDTINPNVNVVFLCLGHGKSKSFLEDLPNFPNKLKIIGVQLLLLVSAFLILPVITSQQNSSNVFANELQSNGLQKFYKAFTNSELDYFEFYETLPEEELVQFDTIFNMNYKNNTNYMNYF